MEVEVTFAPGEKCKKTRTLTQHDYGQYLEIHGLALPATLWVYFNANPNCYGKTLKAVASTVNDVTTVRIPDEMIKNDDCLWNYNVYACIFVFDETSGRTEYGLIIPVNATPRTDVIEELTEEERSELEQAIAAMNAALESKLDTTDIDETLTLTGKAADAKVVGDELERISSTIVNKVEVDSDGLVSFKNASGITLFTLDLSEFSVGESVYGELVLSAETLAIKEGASGTFTVKLATAPTTNQIVYLALSDNTKLSITPSTLTFTPNDYDTEQTVTVTALEDDDTNDETITISLTSKKVSAKQLVVSIEDNDIIPFNGKEIASNLDFSTWSLTTDNEDGQPRCTDIANNEVIIGITNNGGIVKPLEQFTSGTSAITGDKSIAGEKIANNESGNFTFLFIMEQLPQNTEINQYLLRIAPICYSYWNSNQTQYVVYYNLSLMKYLNSDNETIDFSIKGTMTDITIDAIAQKNWNNYYSACVLHNDGRVEFHLNGVPIHTTEPIEGFVSWVWEGHSWSSMSYSQSLASSGKLKKALIINDAVTPQEVIDYYEYLTANENLAF